MKSYFTGLNENKILFIPLIFFAFIIIAETACILILNSGLFVYTSDDAYIHLALAENILRGHYGVNLQEYSSPSSSILWPFILAPFSGFKFGDLIPLIINIISAAGSVFIFFFILKKVFPDQTGSDIKFVRTSKLLLILLIIGTNLTGSLFSGMEHSLQIFLTLANVLGLIIIISEKIIPKWLLPVIILAPIIRYENLTLSFTSLIFLYFTGHKKHTVFSFFIILVLVSGFSWFLLNLGLKALPFSVLQKSSVISSGGIDAVLANLGDNVLSPRGALLLIGAFILAVTSFTSGKESNERLLSVLFSLAVLIHIIIGKEGRYIVYIWSAAIFIFLFLYRDLVVRTVLKASLTKITILSTAITALFSYYYILSILTIPVGSNNIYEQQYQMHRFAVEYYKKPVAVNDLGYVAYRNDNFVLDLVGLASAEALEYQKTSTSSEWIDTLTRKNNVELVMIYDDWFDNFPESWYKAAELHLGKIKMSSSRDKVSFYLLYKEDRNEIKLLLNKFKETLPGGVRLEIKD